jgi:acyl carrier protein
MTSQAELAQHVLDCANRITKKTLHLPPDGDLPLDAFGFDSLSFFGYLLELERTCGVGFDSILLHQEQLGTIRSTAALIAAAAEGAKERPRDSLESHP